MLFTKYLFVFNFSKTVVSSVWKITKLLMLLTCTFSSKTEIEILKEQLLEVQELVVENEYNNLITE